MGETATNNWNPHLTRSKYTIQVDYDATVFNRRYNVDLPLHGDLDVTISSLTTALKSGDYNPAEVAVPVREKHRNDRDEYNTQNVLHALQELLPASTRFTIDIGEFMSYVIHHMPVRSADSFDINVHFGAMGSGIGSAIGAKLADPDRPTVSITGMAASSCTEWKF